MNKLYVQRTNHHLKMRWVFLESRFLSNFLFQESGQHSNFNARQNVYKLATLWIYDLDQDPIWFNISWNLWGWFCFSCKTTFNVYWNLRVHTKTYTTYRILKNLTNFSTKNNFRFLKCILIRYKYCVLF